MHLIVFVILVRSSQAGGYNDAAAHRGGWGGGCSHYRLNRQNLKTNKQTKCSRKEMTQEGETINIKQEMN